MVQVGHEEPLESLIDKDWGPMRHVQEGADRLGAEGRLRVARRVAATVARFPVAHPKGPALRRLFSFLSQVEVIAIEVPIAAMPGAGPETRPLLQRQLEDEVFHALVFAVLAKRLGGLDTPIAEAERLLDRIRNEPDPKTTAILLNAIAEGWIENLFDHAATWGIADEVFQTILADEARHVQEALQHASGVDASHVERSVRAFEADLFGLSQHPRVVLPILTVAGEDAFRRLSASFLQVHTRALRTVGLEPDPAIVTLDEQVDGLDISAWMRDDLRPRKVEPETQWRRTALQIWDTPRHPVMMGWFDVRVDHFPRKLITPIMVAAVGQVWAEYPRMNRYTWAGEVWEPAGVNVGVRIALGDREVPEALSTIVIPNADTRSLNDIVRILQAGVARMNEVGAEVEQVTVDPEAEALATILTDKELMDMVPPESVTCPVTVSNLGRAGLMAGFGSMPGSLGQSVELVIGRVEKRPVWTGWRYAPRDVVTLAAGADHRVVDGNHCAEAIRRIDAALGPQSVRRILARPDTLEPETEVEEQVLGALGITQQSAQVFASCKLPFWLGWMCWLFKK